MLIVRSSLNPDLLRLNITPHTSFTVTPISTKQSRLILIIIRDFLHQHLAENRHGTNQVC